MIRVFGLFRVFGLWCRDGKLATFSNERGAPTRCTRCGDEGWRHSVFEPAPPPASDAKERP